jgi:hypothetical protein
MALTEEERRLPESAAEGPAPSPLGRRGRGGIGRSSGSFLVSHHKSSQGKIRLAPEQHEVKSAKSIDHGVVTITEHRVVLCDELLCALVRYLGETDADKRGGLARRGLAVLEIILPEVLGDGLLRRIRRALPEVGPVIVGQIFDDIERMRMDVRRRSAVELGRVTAERERRESSVDWQLRLLRAEPQDRAALKVEWKAERLKLCRRGRPKVAGSPILRRVESLPAARAVDAARLLQWLGQMEAAPLAGFHPATVPPEAPRAI